MSLGSLALILTSVTLSAVAQIAFKFGVGSGQSANAHALPGPLAMLLAPSVMLGLALYGFGTILWLTALSQVELSKAYPFIGIGFALTALAGWWLFGEQLTAPRAIGIALIACGIVLVARS